MRYFRLEEGGIVTDCSIRTLEPDDVMEFEFSLTSVAAKIIMKVWLFYSGLGVGLRVRVKDVGYG